MSKRMWYILPYPGQWHSLLLNLMWLQNNEIYDYLPCMQTNYGSNEYAHASSMPLKLLLSLSHILPQLTYFFVKVGSCEGPWTGCGAKKAAHHEAIQKKCVRNYVCIYVAIKIKSNQVFLHSRRTRGPLKLSPVIFTIQQVAYRHRYLAGSIWPINLVT